VKRFVTVDVSKPENDVVAEVSTLVATFARRARMGRRLR